MRSTKKTSFFSEISRTVRHDIKKLKRKKTMWKLEAVLFIILPILIVLIAVKAMHTYARIKLRQIATQHKVRRIRQDSDQPTN